MTFNAEGFLDRVESGGDEGGNHWQLSDAERALMFAHGKVMVMLLTMLKSRGLLDAHEFASVLGIFSVVVAQDDRLQGDILAVWVGMMQEIP